MTNKTTKRALLSSVVAMLLCISMFAGTTFAWFTDSATSSGNRIVAGTLKVDLLMDKAKDGVYTSIKNGEGDIFSEATGNGVNWEPGKTEIVYLAVKNDGSLALKYNILLNITDGGLVGALEYAIIDGGQKANVTATDWETLKANAQTGEVVAGRTPASPNGQLEANDTDYFALAVHMKDAANNDYQGKDITIDVTVVATQLTSEEDSFNNQYDADAKLWNGIIPETQPQSLELTPAAVRNQGGTITIGDVDAFVYLNKLVADFEAKAAEIDGYDNYYYHWEWDIELAADIDLFNIPVDSIQLSFFDGFNGNGHTISNVVLKDGSTALFDKGSVINLNLANVVVNAPSANTVGAVVGTNAYLNNVHVVNATVNGGKYVGGLAGKGSSFINCSIKDSTVTATNKTVGGLVGYSIGDPGLATVSGNTVENVTVIGAYNVGGLLGQAQNETVENNTVKATTVISSYVLPSNASSNEVQSAPVAARVLEDATIGTNTTENVTCINSFEFDPANRTFTVNDMNGFLNLNKLAEEWEELFTDGTGTTYTNYAHGAGADYYYDWVWTIKLNADINLDNDLVDPINIDRWGTFDGQGHMISNAKIITSDTVENEAGLFIANGCALKNIKLSNIHVTGSLVGNSTAGILTGSCNAGVENITITDSSVTGGKYTGGVLGYGYTSVTNCELTNCVVKGGYKIGGIIGYVCSSGTSQAVDGNTLKGCEVDGIGNGIYTGGKDSYIVGKIVGNFNTDGSCTGNTSDSMTTSATENIGTIEAGKTVTQ